MKEIDTEFFIKCIPILNALARRKYPEAIAWRDRVRGYASYSYVIKCFICDGVDEKVLSLQEIREHGIRHLKEHNLLPFI